MAQLYFKYGAMGSSKTANALMARFNYEERGQKVLLAKPQLDTRDGDHIVRSRIGLTNPCVYFHEMRAMEDAELMKYDCIIVDEAQFLTREEVRYLVHLVDDCNIPVICYGLRSDFKGELFPGSYELLVMADKIEEVKTVCWCGKKATFNARFDENGRVLKEGAQVVIGANDQYIGLCRKHWREGNLGPDFRAKKSAEEQAPEIHVPKADKTRAELLRQYAGYDRSREYGCGSELILGGETPPILEKYGYSKYTEGYDAPSDGLAFRLLDFVCDNFRHNGSIGISSGRRITDIIEFCEENENQTNCRGLAILLASLLRLNRVRARHITCMPYEDPFDDCHVVVDCLLPSGKRVMLDPSWRLYPRDKNGEYVSIPRLRELLINGEPVFENPTAGRNGTGFDGEFYWEYMTKNLFRFTRYTLSMEGVDGPAKNSRYVELVPAGYPIENFPEGRRANLVLNDTEFWRM